MAAYLLALALWPLDLVDLTHALAPSSPAWPGAAHLVVAVDADYPQGYFARHFTAGEHAGKNLANLGALPPRGATLTVAPLKLSGGSGAPARVLADVPPAR